MPWPPRRHMHQYGTTRHELAEVAVAARAWAQRNPEAFMRDPLTIDDVLNARMVSDPLSVRDCCLVTDGGGAYVLVRAERAKDLPRPPVYVLGNGTAVWNRQISAMPDVTVTAATQSGREAYAMAGLSAKDMDVVQLYDAFTINTLLFLEDLGFCPKGEGSALCARAHHDPRRQLSQQHQRWSAVGRPGRGSGWLSGHDRGAAPTHRQRRRAQRARRAARSGGRLWHGDL